MRKVVVVGVLLVLAAIAAVWYSKLPSVAFREKRAFITDKLRDPGSVQFRNEHIGGYGTLCGELNSKNGSGGYAGFTRFMSANANAVYLEGNDPLFEMDTQEFIQYMDHQIKVLREHNEILKLQPSAGMLSKRDTEERARLLYFAALWNERCK